MQTDPMRDVTMKARPLTTPPANLPGKNDGKIPPNDNLKHENVQVKVDTMEVPVEYTPAGEKTRLNYIA